MINKKQIFIIGGLFVLVVALVIALIYGSVKEEKIPEKVIITPEPTIRVPDRTPDEEHKVVSDIISESVTGDKTSYNGYSEETYGDKAILTDVSYEEYYNKIIEFATGRNWEAIQDMADKILSEYQITNPDWMSFFSVCSSAYTFNSELDDGSRQLFLASITDPQLYVMVFSAMTTEEQAAFLPRLNMTVLPNGTNHDCYIRNFEEAGSFYSEAYRYFSDFEKTKIYNVSIEFDDGGKYDVYFAKSDETYQYMITNITHTDNSYVDTTYEDYFEFSGTEPAQGGYD